MVASGSHLTHCFYPSFNLQVIVLRADTSSCKLQAMFRDMGSKETFSSTALRRTAQGRAAFEGSLSIKVGHGSGGDGSPSVICSNGNETLSRPLCFREASSTTSWRPAMTATP